VDGEVQSKLLHYSFRQAVFPSARVAVQSRSTLWACNEGGGISKAAPSCLVPVNGYSVMIGRGDLFHAGSSGEETNTICLEPTNLRRHLYAARAGAKLLDAVHLQENGDFKYHDYTEIVNYSGFH
jgi:hypothetical protein